MAAQHKTFAQRAQSEQGSVLYRPPVEQASGWEIVREPMQRRVSQSPIVNLGSGGANCSCVLAGTSILMADGSTRMVETFAGGEQVRTLRGVGTVVGVDRITLGVTRRVIELINARGESLFISDEHSMWMRFGEGADEQEWWGTYNYSHYFMEKCRGEGIKTTRDAHPVRFDLPHVHATIDGWHSVQPVYHLMSPDTPLFHLNVENGGSYIADGFVISSHATDADCVGARWEAEACVAL